MIDPFAGFDYPEDLLERSDILREWCREDHDFEYAVKYFTMCSDALKQLRDHLEWVDDYERPEDPGPSGESLDAEYRILDLKTKMAELQPSIQRDQNNIQKQRIPLNLKRQFEGEELLPIAEDWRNLQIKKLEIVEDRQPLEKYQAALDLETKQLDRISDAINIFLRSNQDRTGLKMCQKCMGNGCNECNNGFINPEDS
ncbi:MAG: hypothetical protein CL923_06690 [Deltaproteobacteria bacterium]|nr:hypothetical protein [Deltaproteobacteria bacterium]